MQDIELLPSTPTVITIPVERVVEREINVVQVVRQIAWALTFLALFLGIGVGCLLALLLSQ